MNDRLQVIFIGAIVFGLTTPLQSAAQPAKTVAKPKELSTLMPAKTLTYLEMKHGPTTDALLKMIKGSALADYAAFRDDLYKKYNLFPSWSWPQSAWWAFVLTPEFLNEIARIEQHAVAFTGIKEGRWGPEPKFLWVIDPGTSNIPSLIARDCLTLIPRMKTVKKVEGIRVYQYHSYSYVK